MRLALVLAPCVLALCAVATPAPAGDSVESLLATLHRAQDALALSGASARPVHDRVLKMLDRRIAADAGATRTESVVRYALSGGDPRIARAALSRTPPTAREAILVRGTLAYVSGRTGEARRLLALIDPDRLRGRVAGLVTMAKAGAATRARAPEEAERWLRRVRLDAPGTLIEEAAMRRLAAIALKAGRGEDFLRTARQYWRRFPRSAFRGEMERMTRIGVLRFGDRASLARIGAVAQAMPPALRQNLYAATAHAALVDGRSGLATFATRRLAGPKANLLKTLPRLTGRDAPRIARRLDAFAGERLAPRERRLLAASRSVARAIMAPLTAPPAGSATRRGADDAPPRRPGRRRQAADRAVKLPAFVDTRPAAVPSRAEMPGTAFADVLADAKPRTDPATDATAQDQFDAKAAGAEVPLPVAGREAPAPPLPASFATPIETQVAIATPTGTSDAMSGAKRTPGSLAGPVPRPHRSFAHPDRR